MGRNSLKFYLKCAFQLTDYVLPPGKNYRCQLKYNAASAVFNDHALHLQ